MYGFKLPCLLTFIFTSFAIIAYGQLKYSNEYLNIGVGARAHGLSNAQIATVNDVTAGYWNPAGLAHINGHFTASAMHAEWFAGIAQFDYIGIAKPINKEKSRVIGASIIRLGIDQIPNTLYLVSPDGTINYNNVTEFSAADYAILLSYGQKLKNTKFSIGGNAKIIRRVIGRFGNAWGFGFDLGMQYTGKHWSFGVMGRDITSTYNAWKVQLTENERFVFNKEGNVIPESTVEITLPRIILGGAYRQTFKEKVSFLAEINFDFTTDGQRNVLVNSQYFNIDPHMGIEVGYNKFVFLRGGIGNIQTALDDINGESEIITLQPNFGVGLRLGRIHLDYALTDIGDVSQVLFSHIFSLSVAFKSKEVEVIDISRF